MGTLKNPTKCLWHWEPDRRSNFFFNPPAHLCAVTYMTEISLIVTLNNQFNSTQLKKLYLRSGSQRHRHFEGFLNVPILHRHGTTIFIRWSRLTAHLCAVTYITEISFHVTLNNQSQSPCRIQKLWPMLKVFQKVRLGYCFTPYQRLWLYNGAPLVVFYDTLGIRGTYSRFQK